MAAVDDKTGAPVPVFTPATRGRAIAALEEAIDRLGLFPVQTPCVECVHFDGGFCERWGTEVPEEHQAQGCEDWIENEIPF